MRVYRLHSPDTSEPQTKVRALFAEIRGVLSDEANSPNAEHELDTAEMWAIAAIYEKQALDAPEDPHEYQ